MNVVYKLRTVWNNLNAFNKLSGTHNEIIIIAIKCELHKMNRIYIEYTDTHIRIYS